MVCYCRPCVDLTSLRVTVRERIAAAAPPVPATQVSSPPILAAGAKLLGQFGDWSAYTAVRAGKKECFDLYPSARDNAARRDADYVFVSTRPRDSVRSELSITAKYQVKQRSEGSALEVGDERFALWGSGNGLWVANPREQPHIVDTMRNAGQLSDSGRSSASGSVLSQRICRGP
jgi:hypothetical protein